MREPAPADRPTLHVDLAALVRNWRAARAAFTGQRLGAVLKYDAYGLGMAPVAAAIAGNGCRDYWLAHLEEAATLRTALGANDRSRIFVLNGLAGHDPAEFSALSLIPVLTHLGEVASASAHAQQMKQEFAVAIHLDSGLTRVGLQERDVDALASDPDRLAGLRLEAWVTQLGRFDDLGSAASLAQRERFERWTAKLPPAERSLATSTGAFGDPGWHFDHARLGSALYGVQAGRSPYAVEAVTTLSAKVLRVADVPAGTEVGYGSTYRTPRPSRLATIAIGYGDGLPFHRNPTANVFFGSKPAPIVGGVSMSLVTADVSALDPGSVKAGCAAELYGPHQSIERLAEAFCVTPNALLVPTARLAQRVWSAP